jgi:hypothetical protein
VPLNHYQILEITPSASKEEIRHAYRRLAKQWHPDLNRSPEAAARFLLIQKAWETLGDDRLRANYDFYIRRYPNREPASGYSRPSGPVPPPNVRTRAYTGYGGRVYYRTVTAEAMEQEDKARRRDWISGLSLIAVVLLIPIVSHYWDPVRLRFKGVESVAGVVDTDGALTYKFAWDGIEMVDEVYPEILRMNKIMVLKDGMPVGIGDRFLLKLLPSDPEVHRLYLSDPDAETRDHYAQMIYQRHLSTPLLDSLADGSMKAVFLFMLCDSLYVHYGTRGLSNLFFADTPAFFNKFNNASTFREMASEKTFRQLLLNCRRATRPFTSVETKSE